MWYQKAVGATHTSLPSRSIGSGINCPFKVSSRPTPLRTNELCFSPLVNLLPSSGEPGYIFFGKNSSIMCFGLGYWLRFLGLSGSPFLHRNCQFHARDHAQQSNCVVIGAHQQVFNLIPPMLFIYFAAGFWKIVGFCESSCGHVDNRSHSLVTFVWVYGEIQH